MRELRPAKELRKEYDEGKDKVFLDTWEKVVDTINSTQEQGKTSTYLSQIVKGHETRA